MIDNLRQAVIAAGGLATRMARTFPGLAKATYPLAGKPMLHHLFRWIESQKLESIHLCVGHLAEQVLDAVPENSPLLTTHTVETSTLGVAGALRLAVSALDPAFVLMYGDVLPRVPLGPLLDPFKHGRLDVQLTVCAASLTCEPPNVILDRDGRTVLGYGVVPSATHLDIGLTLLRRPLVEQLASDRFISTTTLFEMALANGRLGAQEVDIPSLEIGSPAGYRRACEEMASAH